MVDGETLQNLGGDQAAENVIAEAGAIAGAIERAGAIKRTVDRLGVRAYGHSLNETAKARDDLRSKQTAQKLLIVFLFAVGLILFLYAALALAYSVEYDFDIIFESPTVSAATFPASSVQPRRRNTEA